MRLLPGGIFVYDTPEELTYNLINAIGLTVNPDGTLIDRDIDPNGTEIKFAGSRLKVTIDPRDVHYAGEGEMMLDILNNSRMDTTLLGYAIDKLVAEEGLPFLSKYIVDTTDASGNKMNSKVIRLKTGKEIRSAIYYNKCLSDIDLIFQLNEVNVDLRNFDSVDILDRSKRKK